MLRHMRSSAILMAGALGLATNPSAAQSSDPSAQKKAYEITLDCFMLSAYDQTEPRSENDEQRQQELRATARRIWAAAFAMGKVIGLDEWTIDRHLQEHTDRYADALVRNEEYRQRLRATCERLNFA